MGKKPGKQAVIATGSGVVVGDKSSQQRRRWQFVGVVVCSAVLAIAVGGAARWLQTYPAQRKAAEQKAIAEQTNDIQTKSLSGDYDAAHEEIQKQLDKSDLSDNEKQALLFQEGLTYENQKQYDKAIESYKKAAAVKDTQMTAEAMARTYETMGDKQNAIKYYKKAITLIPADYPLADTDKRHYGEAIKRLGG